MSSEEEVADEDVDMLSQQMADSMHGRSESCNEDEARSNYGPPEDVAGREEEIHASQNSNDSSNSMFSRAIGSDRRDPSEARDRDDLSEIAEGGNEGSHYAMFNVGPSCYRFDESIFDSRIYPFPYKHRYYNPHGHLIPDPKDFKKLYSQSKMLQCVPPEEVFKDLRYGVSWSMVDQLTGVGVGISEYLMQVIYWAHTMDLLLQHHIKNGFVVSTSNLEQNLYPKYNPSGKEIIGVISKMSLDRQQPRSLGGAGGVDLRKLLDFGDNASGGFVNRSMPLLEIFVSITGATYESDGEEQQALFGIVTIQWLLNVDFMPLIVVSLSDRFDFFSDCDTSLPQNKVLAAPKANASNFENINKRRNELLELLESILVIQLSQMCEDNLELRPSDFWENPNGMKGAHTLCNPFLEPLKMVNLIKRRHSDAQNIRIIGYPDINWTGNADRGALRDYLNYMQEYAGHIVEWCQRIHEFCKGNQEEQQPRQAGARRRRTAGARSGGGAADDAELRSSDEHEVKIIPGMPASTSQDFFNKWLVSYCPIVMKYRNLKPGSASMSEPCFRVNFGGMPELVTCMMRKFMFFDEENNDSEKLNAINLRGLDIAWNQATVKAHFYNVHNKDNLQIATSGCKLHSYNDALDYIQSSIKEGGMTPHCGVRILLKHFDMAVCTLEAMINAGNFISDLMKQGLEIRKMLFEWNGEDPPKMYSLLSQFQSHILPSTNLDYVVNAFDFARHFLLRCMVGTNDNGQLLNSVNLYNKHAIIVSMLSYSSGRINKTIDVIGRAIEFAPCCGTAREIVNNGNGKTEITKCDNPNGAGKDMCIEKVNQDHEALMQRVLRIDRKSHFEISILDDFTKMSMKLSCCITTTSDGHVISTPDPADAGYAFMSELRDTSKETLNTMVKDVFPRGGNASKKSMTTMESNGARQLLRITKVRDYALIGYCSNQRANDEEQRKTLHAVNHVIPPGATPFVEEETREELEFNDIHRNKFEGRSYPYDELWGNFAGMFAATQVIPIVYTGKLNDMGFYLCELNPAIRAALDFTTFYAQHYYESMFSPNSRKGRFIRLKKVYESRESAFTMWIKTTQYMMECPDFNTAMIRTIADFQCDPIALSNCGNLLYNMLFRCISWVPCFLSRCFIMETRMPVVPTEILIELLSMTNQPRPGGSELRVWYDRICMWLQECLSNCRFCNNPNGGGLCEYISSNGSVDGSVESNGLFRVSRKQNAWNEAGQNHTVQTALAEEIWIVHGNQLHLSCSLSKESLIPAINDMLSAFSVDFGKLIGVDIQATARHFEFFGISQHMQLNPFITPDSVQCQFAIQAAWMRDAKESASVGIGVHVIQLLLLGAFMGDSFDILHPHLISEFTRNLTREILIRSPAAMTPTDKVEVVSFHCFNNELEPINLASKIPRPHHFMRVQMEQFARTGDLSEIKNAGRFAAEDILHNGALFRWAEILGLGTDVKRVPATAPVCYYIQQNKNYCIYNQVTGCIGVIYMDGENIHFEAETSPGSSVRTGKQFEPLAWHCDLMEEGFIILPMIRRPGACVALNDEKIGVLIPPGSDEASCDNLDLEDFTYRAKTREGEVHKVKVLDVMDTLLPIGTKLYLKMESPSAGPLLLRLTFALSLDMQRQHALRVFLNSPNVLHPIDGKVYVAILCKQGKKSKCETFPVDPFELLLSLGGRVEIQHINISGHA